LLTLCTPCIILTSNYSNQQVHIKWLKIIYTYKMPTCFSANAPPSGNLKCKGLQGSFQWSWYYINKMLKY
jgi:hypothetical protein